MGKFIIVFINIGSLPLYSISLSIYVEMATLFPVRGEGFERTRETNGYSPHMK